MDRWHAIPTFSFCLEFLLSFFPFFSGSLCRYAPTVESQHSVLGGVGSGSVLDRSAIARHKASFFKLVEWSEQFRSMTCSARHHSPQSSNLALHWAAGARKENLFGFVSLPWFVLIQYLLFALSACVIPKKGYKRQQTFYAHKQKENYNTSNGLVHQLITNQPRTKKMEMKPYST